MKNHKGDIPITILVIGVFVVCTLALVSFFSITLREKNSFVGINLMQKINSQIETYHSHSVLTGLDIRISSEGRQVLYQEKKETRGFLWWKKDIVLFSVEYNLE